ncbi:MAG TPA: endonuclease/exonuclease/phosphatase family protein, partial [Planctomycetes bacterium]|nr:endonuclease/exonuclease/phosphatase family protein [Planctomycetota bacterium]
MRDLDVADLGSTRAFLSPWKREVAARKDEMVDVMGPDSSKTLLFPRECGAVAIGSSCWSLGLARAKFLRLAEQGIETHPGPAVCSKVGIRIETVNSTDKAPFLQRLKDSRADVVCGQELKVTEAELDRFTKAVWNLGWRCRVTPCTFGEGGGRSCGTGVFVRRHMCIWEDPLIPSRPAGARATVVVVAGDGLAPFVVASVYAAVGEGPSPSNCRLIKDVLVPIIARGLPWLVGADWNMDPETLRLMDLPKFSGSRIISDGTGVGTCTAGKTPTTIDYFLVSSK